MEKNVSPNLYDATYRRVSDSLPRTAWLVASVTILERWSYYAFTGPFQNYIQNRADDPLRPGALGLGESKASLMVNVFLIVSYLSPMGAAVLADGFLGRRRTVTLSFGLYVLGVACLFVTSFPEIRSHGAGLPGFIAAMITISLALGGIKASLPPLLAEQCSQVQERVKILKSGERVIVCPKATVQYAFDMYYWCMNIGAQSRIVTTLLEEHFGFWTAYLMALCSLSAGGLLFFLCRNLMASSDVQEPVLLPAMKASIAASRHKFSLDAVRPEVMRTRNGKTVTWTDGLIDDLKRAFFACRVFTPFIIYWLCQSQMTTNTISQAAEMETHGIPNDMLPAINSSAVIIFLPIVTKFVYPFLHRHQIRTPPIRRIALGFLLEALGMAYAAGIQHWIYISPPCYSRPRACLASDNGRLPNAVHIGYQTPVYFLEGLSEIFASPAGYEYAFSEAPTSMKSIVQAVYASTAAGGGALALALSPLAKDPSLLWVYAGLAGAMGLAAVVMGLVSWKYERRVMLAETAE